MDTQTTQAVSSWLDSIKVKFQEFITQFELSRENIIEYGIALAAGIFAGFLVKKYARQAVITFLVFGLFLGGLHYFEFITIDWLKVKGLIGLAPAETVESFFHDYWLWVKAHLVAVIVSVIGFIIGYKIG